jgi:hypothetical protein
MENHKKKVNLFLNAEPNGEMEFSLEGDQLALEYLFSEIYKIPQGREFVGRLLKACQLAYFDNEHSN